MSTNANNAVIVIPTYNEGTAKSEPYRERVNQVLRTKKYSKKFIDNCNSNIFRTLAVLRSETQLPIIVVDDGSTDDTFEEVKRFQTQYQNHRVTLLSHAKNKGKGAAFLTALEQLSKETKQIVTTDADMIIPNNIIQLLCDDFCRYSGASSKLAMTIACCRAKQSRATVPDKDFIVDSASGTRMLSLAGREEMIQKKGRNAVYDLITGFPYGLETALNNLFPTIIGSSTIVPNPAEKLARFLPACRHYAHFDHINEQICGTQNLYHKHFGDYQRKRKVKQRFRSFIIDD